MKNIVLLFLTTLFFAEVHAEIIWDANNDGCQNISGHVYFLEDTEDRINIVDLSSGKYDSCFRLSNKPMLNFGFNESAYWLRFEFVNKTPDSLFLELAHAFIPYAELFYQSENGKWKSIKSGYKVNLKDKIIKDHHQIFPLPSDKKKIYIKLIPYLHPIKVNIWQKDAYLLNANKQRIIYGLYAGILFFAITINIFLFFALKKSYYLQYALLVFLYTAASAGVMEGYMIYFFSDADMMYWYKIIPVLNMPALLFYCITFLEIKKVSSTMYTVTFLISVFLILYIIYLHFSPLLPFLFLNQIFALAVFILTIVLGVVVGKKGNKLGYYFSITYSIWFILLCFEEIHIQFGVPEHVLELSYVSVAIFVEAFLLAFLLAKRFQWERNDDEKIKFEMQQSIVEIKQRFQNEIMQAQLEMQEETFKNISQEIHDNIGQTLSLIKINLSMVDNKIPESEREKISDSKELLSKAIHELRDLTKNMNTDFIKQLGLTKAIEQQVEFIRKTGKYIIDYSVTGSIEAYELQKELLIFRIIQELINNTIKHAHADHIDIGIQYENKKMTLIYSDNGKGFDMDEVSKEKLKGIGLSNIINRTELIGGVVVIKSNPKEGTKITLIVPK